MRVQIPRIPARGVEEHTVSPAFLHQEPGESHEASSVMYTEMNAKDRLCLEQGRRQGLMSKVVLWLLQWHALTHTS